MNPVTLDMNIGEIVKKYPMAADVLLSYGLQCVGCAINPYETLKQGALGHGMDESTIDEMLGEVNFAITKKPDYDLNPDGLTISPRAIEALNVFAKEQGIDTVAIKVEAEKQDSGINYMLDFATEAKSDEETIEWQGVKIFLTKSTLDLINPTIIDFISTDHQEGFKFISLKEERCACDKPMSECGCEGSKKEGGCCGGGCR